MGGGTAQALLGGGGGLGGAPGGGNNPAMSPIMAMIQAMSGAGAGGPPRAPPMPAMPGMPGGPQPAGTNPAPLVPPYMQYKPNFGTPPPRPNITPPVDPNAEAQKQMLLEQQRLDAMNRQGSQVPYQDYNNVGA